MYRFKRVLWTSLALLFLAVSWLWDTLHPIIRGLIALLPLEGVKRVVMRFMDRLPPYPTLFIFLIPIVVIEPLKVLAVWITAKGLFLTGPVLYVSSEVLRLGLVAFLFNTCRDKLLSIPWFNELYKWFLWAHEWADAQVAPARAYIARAFEEAGMGRGGGSVFRRVAALWRYTRRRRYAA